MLYTSQNGCFFYYDRDTYSWELCEPTLMFLLGFEAITMYDKAKSDHLLISNKLYDTSTGVIDDMPYFDIYDEAISFLATLGHVEDGEDYAQYNCYGLKLLLNDLTGISTDRTVPVIFLNDINRKLIDPNKYPYADKAGKSYYDLQSTLILNVFKYAGYDLLDNEVALFSERLVGVDPYNSADNNVPPRLDEIIAYNNSVSILHEEKQAAGNIYKLLDYKAMYLYALGVLYGLRSMGYDGRMIWRFDPAYWYFGKYQNLVKTAWAVFRFHYSHSIYELDTPEELVNKYKDIQYNKLWNFMNSEDLSDVVLFNNETFAYAVYVKDIDPSNPLELNRVSVKPIIYLYPSDEDVSVRHDRGNYIEYDSDSLSWTEPQSVDSLVSSDAPYKGIIAADSDTYTRYIANDVVNIRKALRYSRNIPDPDNPSRIIPPQYLAPNNESLGTIPSGTTLYVSEIVGDYFKVEYDGIVGWISNSYTDDTAEESYDIELLDGEFLTESFGADIGNITTINDTPIKNQPSNTKSYFISTGNFGWTDFDLTYWKNFKQYNKSYYDSSDIGDILEKEDANTASVLTMLPQEYQHLYPSRIGSAFSSLDGTTVSYYKCNVTDDTYLYGIFDGYIANDEKGRPDFSSDDTNVSDHFKYILSAADFESIYVASIPENDFVKSIYYDVDRQVAIYVNTTSEPHTLWDGINAVRLDAFGYTKYASTAIDAYFYNADENVPESFDLRKYLFNGTYKYWSHEFEKSHDDTYGDYIEWVVPPIHTVNNEQVYETTGDTVTLYMNVRKLFDNTKLYDKLDNDDNFRDYICNTNKEYTAEFGKRSDDPSLDNLPLGFTRYSSLYNLLGVTTHLCPIIETDPNGDSLVIDGVPYVWHDPETDNYWNGFINQWQSEVPTRCNAVMYNSTTNKLINILDDPDNRTVIVENDVSITYEEFYIQYPDCGILRDHTIKVFSTDYVEEGIIDCYYDTKLSDNVDDHIICVPGRVPWVHRSELKNYNYWIVDGTASLYDGTDVIHTVYDDDHVD